jgi:hypothetical protein
MNKYIKNNGVLLLILCFIANISCADQLQDFPCLIVKNGNSNSFIVNDPNWDDQILIINGKKVHAVKLQVKAHEEINICGLYNEFGIIFEDFNQQYITSAVVSNYHKAVTTIDFFPDNKFKYQILNQAQTRLYLEILN